MKINSVDNNTNFGWRYKTHEKITAMVVDEFPDLKKYKSVLTKMVVMPDFDERGFKGNNHFYYTPQLCRPRESFMDFTGNNNAAARYEQHVYSFEEFAVTNPEKALCEAGRALHFLQDVTQPHHIERGTILDKWRDLKVHEAFEAFAHHHEDEFIKNAKNVYLDVTPNDNSDLFEEAVFLSEQISPAKNHNKNDWANIAQESLSNTIAVTREFLANVSAYLK